MPRILFFQAQGYESYEQQLEDEQDFMGLYESELNKQIHLRNRQKKEWDMMKKKIAFEEEQRIEQAAQGQNQIAQEQREADRVELEETQTSKNLAAAMLKSSLSLESDTLQKVVEVLQNQNGKLR